MAETTLVGAILFQLKELFVVWLGLSVVGCISAIWLFNERQNLKRYASDILVRKRCREERKPLGVLTNKSGTRFEFVIEPDKKKPGTINYKDFTLRNPNLASSKVRGQLSNGIPFVDYVVSCDFPVSHQSLAALDQLVKNFREKYPEMSFMDEIYVIEGVFKESKYAYNDCVQLVKRYLDMGVEMPKDLFFVDFEEEQEQEQEEEDEYNQDEYLSGEEITENTEGDTDE